MAKAPDPEAAQPSAGIGRSLDALHAEVARLRVDVDYKSDMRDIRNLMSEMRDCLTRIEVRIEHLPSKGFIVLVLTPSLIIANGLVMIAHKLCG